ncbi:hypothetical protein CHLNCDRAFT_143156 [Chlorella variabilis]|uniref:WW domain-containing protein n=1 Tax=Chlorella variabilis TaxID=554065 RepID=E1Z9L1_CHLVA|nr:hypothetical protein CHLNCDRAFT_143156 [Chlorella variabilis]EFN57537.1 hypothetical protein CHLNCDRAFT_143156 [Chlorella variabilis]|eukprot:XP_005849639.1 hypothetical protein CHLNCDRAFT_143156 [Chlorella variabilis]
MAEPAADDPELAALEQLADQIQATEEDEEGAAHDWEQAAGGGGGGGGGGPWVRDCWESAVDMNSGTRYWFNRATGVSQWQPPAGWSTASQPGGPPGAAEQPQRGTEQPAAPALAGEAGGAQQPHHAAQRDYKPGLYYRDAAGQLQGPFTTEQLRDGDDAKEGASGDGASKAAGEGTSSAGSRPGGDSGGDAQSQGGAAAGEAGARWSQAELAEVVGDEELLARWRMENPEQARAAPPPPHLPAAWPGAATPAAAYEAERQRGSAHSLAEAVLFGLPAHDEAVAVARMAASSGRSIQEVVAWAQEQSVDYGATAYRVAARGRIQAPGAPESLYAEVASWANPHELEQQLAKAAERRKRALTGEELRQVKQRKQEMKEKKRTAWLFT